MSDFNIEFEENDQQIKLEFEQAGGGAVKSVNGKTGVVVLDAEDVGAYTKPSGGIPKTDLATAVQTSLGKADTAYQKPSGGIPASDIASGAIPTVDNTLTTAGAAADAKKTGDEISDLKDGFNDLKEDINTIETKVDEVAVYPNLANPNGFTTGKYVAPNGSIYSASGLSYSEKISVTPGQVIKANHRARFITAYNGNTANAEASVNDQTGTDAPTTYTVPEGITDLIFTFRDQYLSDLIIYVYDGIDYDYIPYGKVSAIRTSLLPVPLGVYAERKNRTAFSSISGSAFSANTFVSIPVFCSTRKNSRLVYRAQVSSLGNFEIGFTTSASASGTKYNRFVIRQNGITAYTHYDYTQSAMHSEAIDHNLNIITGLLEVIIEELPNAKV